jgi:hypothetical protein
MVYESGRIAERRAVPAGLERIKFPLEITA